tara:strand:+ start:949 stop:1374 length:426 start_codon:yes stop_codon:yes gene_type:complete
MAIPCAESSDICTLRADPALLLRFLAPGRGAAIEERFKNDTKSKRADPQNENTGKYPKPISIWLRMIRHFLSGSLIQECPERKAQGIRHEAEQNQDADNLENTLGVLVLVGKKVAQLIAIADFRFLGRTFCGVTHQGLSKG